MEPSQKLMTFSVTGQTSTDTKTVGVFHCVLSDHHGVKLEFNNNSTPRKPTNSWKLNSPTTEPSLGQGRNKERNESIS